jgi:hypothetical protein
MSQSHVIDSWIAELGLSAMRNRHSDEPVPARSNSDLAQPRPGPEAPPALPARAFQRRPGYLVISSPC